MIMMRLFSCGRYVWCYSHCKASAFSTTKAATEGVHGLGCTWIGQMRSSRQATLELPNLFFELLLLKLKG